MRSFTTMIFRCGVVLCALMILVPATAWACSLTKVGEAKKAELKVYFTKFQKEDNTQGKYKKCRIVKKGGKSFFVTPFRQDANVVVHRINWPK